MTEKDEMLLYAAEVRNIDLKDPEIKSLFISSISDALTSAGYKHLLLGISDEEGGGFGLSDAAPRDISNMLAHMGDSIMRQNKNKYNSFLFSLKAAVACLEEVVGKEAQND